MSTPSTSWSVPPPSMRDRSSSSLTIWTRWPVSTSILAIRSRILAGIASPTASASRLRVSASRLTVVSGVRSSCDRLSMNSVRMRWSRRSSETSSRTSHTPPLGARRARMTSAGPSGPAERISPVAEPACQRVVGRAPPRPDRGTPPSPIDRPARRRGGRAGRARRVGVAGSAASASRRTTPASSVSWSAWSSAERSASARCMAGTLALQAARSSLPHPPSGPASRTAANVATRRAATSATMTRTPRVPRREHRTPCPAGAAVSGPAARGARTEPVAASIRSPSHGAACRSKAAVREGVAQDEQVGDAGRGASAAAPMRAPTPSPRRRPHRPRRRIGRRELARDAQGVVLLGRRGRRPRRVAQPLERARRRPAGGARRPSRPRARSRSVADAPSWRARSGAGRRPRPSRGSAARGPARGRIAQQLVEDVAQDELGQLADDRVADRRPSAVAARRQRGDGLASASSSVRSQLGLDEPAEGRDEGDRRGLGEGQAVELVAVRRADALDDARDALGRSSAVGGRARRARRGRPRGTALARGRAATACRSRARGRSARAGRVAEPVVGDVDALGEVEAVRPGDVRVVAAQEAAPGELDRLRAGVEGTPRRAYRSSAGSAGGAARGTS